MAGGAFTLPGCEAWASSLSFRRALNNHRSPPFFICNNWLINAGLFERPAESGTRTEAVWGQLMIIGRLKAVEEEKWINEWMKAAWGMLQWSGLIVVVWLKGFWVELDVRDSWIHLFSIQSTPPLTQSVYVSAFHSDSQLLPFLSSSAPLIFFHCIPSQSPAVFLKKPLNPFISTVLILYFKSTVLVV